MANLHNSDQEIWKAVPGYEGIYEASTFGRIRSLDRIVTYKRNPLIQRRKKGRIMKPFYNHNGYLLIDLCDKTISVHKVILITFVGERPCGWIACMHLNDKKDDNRLENLKWGTYSENALSALANKLYTHGRTGKHGKSNPQSMPVAQLTLSGELIKKYESMIDAYRETGIYAIPAACAGKRKTAGGFLWKKI